MPSSNRIAALRAAAGVSKAALARELSVDASTLYRWERGKVGIPDEQKVALALRFGVTVDEMMGWATARGARTVA